jgi:beta-galactosidase/beta-glucuronidase
VEPEFADSSWDVVDLPHDFSINGTFTNNGDTHHGYLPRNVSWYRKHFRLPDAWKGSTVQLYFEGAFHFASVYVNGQWVMDHRCGYTGFAVRLDNISSTLFGNGVNVIAVRTDASWGSGHWYEGGGLYRSVHLQKLPQTHFVNNGVFLSPEGDGASATVSAEVENLGIPSPSNVITSETVVFTLIDDENGAKVAECDAQVSLTSSKPEKAQCVLKPKGLTMWSIQNPKVYRLNAVLSAAAGGDSRSVTVGFRTTS